VPARHRLLHGREVGPNSPDVDHAM
jgi:hypothetical protein